MHALPTTTSSTTTTHHRHLQDAPFFVDKLNVRTLPCVVMFVGGVAVDRIVGFDTLGATDDFPTSQVGWPVGRLVCWLAEFAIDCFSWSVSSVSSHGSSLCSAVAGPRVASLRSLDPSFLLPLPPPPGPPEQVEKRLLKAGAVKEAPKPQEDSDDEEALLRRRTMYSGLAQQQRTGSDEDSDFD